MDQAELTPALERVAASLGELEQALQVKAREDAALSELASKQRAQVDQLERIARDIETLLADKDRAAAEIAAQAQAARTRVQDVEGEVAAVKTALLALSQAVDALRASLVDVRAAVDGVQATIGDIQSKASELDAAADGIAGRVCGVADELDRFEWDRQRILSGDEQLRQAGAVLEARRAEAQAASQETQELLAVRGQQAAMLTEQMERLSRLSAGVSAIEKARATDANASYEAHRAAKATQPSPEPPAFARTAEATSLLGWLGLLKPDDAALVLDMLQEGDADKFVRSLWSKAMGGPQPGPYRLIVGSALAEADDQKGAMTFLNKALEGRNLDPMLIYLVAETLLHMKRYVDVLRIAQMLGRTKQGKVLARNIEALHLAASGRADEAERKLAEALIDPAHPPAHHSETMYNLACLARRRGDEATATMWFERLAAADPGYRSARPSYGVTAN